MAVIEALPGVEVTIEVDGQPLREYSDADSDEAENPRTVIRYVEAQNDQVFRIACTVTPRFKFEGDLVCFPSRVDGQEFHSKVIKERHVLESSKTVYREGYRPTQESLKRFTFNAIELTSEDTLWEDALYKAQKTGIIAVEVHHKIVNGNHEKPSSSAEDGISIVPERALKGKAISHSVKFGSDIAIAPKKRVLETLYVDYTETPAATFIFYYRSEQALKSLMIIPRTPSPPPIEEEYGPTSQKIRQLQRQVKELKISATIGKRDRVEDLDVKPEKRVCSRPIAGDMLTNIDGAPGTAKVGLPFRTKRRRRV